ncbi:NAD(P)-dependent alcohol dehydrogenase [Brumimicrobium mesophilum]|uniref:NAD(P)-dependent alcohol dehydrogenase n=1 Tax=Brumimicrobium mesophilum TaxID=392717 RepID=UPI000D14340C|nr:NAD(P)-dependent alcohol dehydrogenase [Brumimicrobium mesophilum]
MKALTRKKYGSPKVLRIEKVEKPIPKEEEILVKVFASTVNRTDCASLRGKPLLTRVATGLFSPKRKIMGTDFAGQVVAIGNKVSNFKVNDKVWGFNDQGLNSHAEYLTIDANKEVIKIPPNTDYASIVCAAEGAHYALNFVNKVEVKPNSKILLNGATGAIGSSLLQILKYQAKEVTAVCNTKNIDLIQSLAADKIINYEVEKFTEAEPESTYDFIFDAVGKSRFSECKHLLKDNGIYISSELGKNAENVFLAMSTQLKSNKKVIFPIPSDIKTSLQFMSDMVDQGKFKSIIDKTFSIDEITKAYEYVETGNKTGSVVVQF